jgi:EAL domain-containing protein (putative c-di-GMP-specific phosphodiesterase class I)/GGDEF domain-containing protein
MVMGQSAQKIRMPVSASRLSGRWLASTTLAPVRGARRHELAEAPFGTIGGVPLPFLGDLTVPDDHVSLPPAAKSWQFLGLIEIANFVALRRHVGVARADMLVVDVSDRILAAFPALRLAEVGRTQLEVVADGDALADLEALTGAITALFEQAVDLDGEPHRIELLIGGAAAPFGNTEEVRLIEEAESALDLARAERHPVVRDLSVGAPAFDRRTLTRELNNAISQGQMFLQYQPKVHVRRQEISSAEALVRWQHPDRGLILPGDFITIAEEAREICALTLWTLDQVIHDQRLLAADGHQLTVFINISGQLLGDARFVKQACARVRESGARIGFEITETAVIRDPQSAIANLKTFADVGITIAIDDYGAGLSSLAYLKQLPARELKIDKMFVLQLTSSNRDPLIVRSTIDLAHALEMEVTAEGVETQAAMALLTVMGCDMVQGYLLSRPLSIDAFRHFLAADKAATPEEQAKTMFARPASFWKSA